MASIVDIKETEEAKYCIVDGGIHQVNYYGQTMAMRTPDIEQFPKRPDEKFRYNICGSVTVQRSACDKQTDGVD